MTDFLVHLLVFLVGACIGSFLNVCVARWPRGHSVVQPRSRCPRCARPIAWYENIPILSWFALRGRCRGCHERISPLYPLVEFAVGVGWLLAALHFGMTFTALRVAVLGTTLLGIALTDAEHYLIPDGFTAFGLAWGMLAAAAGTLIGETAPFVGLYEALIGACVGAGAIAITGWLGELVFKKEAMGFGDVTLMAVVGAHLGGGRALLTVFIAAVLGSVLFAPVAYAHVVLRRGRTGEQLELSLGKPPLEMPLVPFGVFLAPAAMIALLWGQYLMDWYATGVLGL